MSVKVARLLNRLGLSVTHDADKQVLKVSMNLDRKKAANQSCNEQK